MAIEKSVEIIERMVLENLPQSISQESVNAVFSKAVNRIKKGEVNQPQLQQFLLTFQSSFTDKMLDSLEVLDLLERIDQLGGPVAGK